MTWFPVLGWLAFVTSAVILFLAAFGVGIDQHVIWAAWALIPTGLALGGVGTPAVTDRRVGPSPPT